jgi:hypothetical protein
MNTETQNEVVTKELPKSKRLSSFIWILMLWGFVRLIAGMDGISWTRSLWVPIALVGAIPATLLLICALVFPIRYQLFFRWTAAIATPLSLLGAFFVKDDNPESQMIFFGVQLLYPIFLIGFAWFKQAPKESSYD